MSREQYRARSKKVQKLGRDGLVEQDKATGQEERISQRAADVSFGPDRPQDQAGGRVSARRTPAQGKRRKQPRPPSSPESVQPAPVDVPDLQSSVSDMRQADDGPPMAPPPMADGVLSNKCRQQKRANQLNPDTPAHPMVKDSTDSGRLHFEPGYDPPADAPGREGPEPPAPHGADDIPMQERPPGRHTPPASPTAGRGQWSAAI